MGHGITWRKSSYGRGVGIEHNCAEEAATNLGAWHKSSYSGANGDCVEVGSVPASALVRDSKLPASPDIRFTADAWAAFVSPRGSGA